ncbi:hypothetical protein JWG41_04090 [Leptospira sp. 201903075]|uniref:hypothetical protein n=1 Tax=Leptospira chreensis TaxID=2810035 RepID=UPI001962D087|nr:hypothetical protein [Leptospira chreensis]MBM9589610.1 hypothetical protein [Leptospira chreensis]
MIKNKKILYIVLISASVLFISILFLRSGKDKNQKDFESILSEGKTFDSRELPSLPEDYSDHKLMEYSVEEIARILQEKYGKNIDNPAAQIAMIEELMKDLPKLYPNDWVRVLNQILGFAFPNKVLELMRMSENLYNYNRFRESNMSKVGLLSDEARRQMIWKERYRLFGEKADQIWSMEKKMTTIGDTLKRIKESPAGNLDAKLSNYSQTLKEQFGKEYPRLMENKRDQLTEGFMVSVQKDLKVLSFGERKSALREIRATMGMDNSALSRWDALEEEREKIWQNQQKYSEKRTQLSSKKGGMSPEEERELDSLRKKLFGEEADIIENEEASGYYRTQEERTYGVN